MAKFRQVLFCVCALGSLLAASRAARADARFDLVGPRIDVRVTRGGETLPIASVPNLEPGDRLWIHPDLPPSQAVHYLLVCVFLRGTTNPPPSDWFIPVETWNRKVQQEGVFVTVPAEAQQAVMLMAPVTGGDFSTLRSAVTGRPGVFVRAAQDLNEAGFEQARIEKYLASIREVPPADAKALQEHSALLARTLALKPNEACFKQAPDTQFTCLTQTGSQTLLDDGHGQTIAQALSSGANSDFINAASYTKLGGGGLYSAYVGAIVDLVRIMANLHTAQYQYIPAIAFPQGEALNLRLNTPPSFHNPKSVLVIGLPAVQAATPPPLRPADGNQTACLLQPDVVLPIEGAPLVFSTELAHGLVLHLNVPAGAPAEPDIPLTADAYLGGLQLHRNSAARVQLPIPSPLPVSVAAVAPQPKQVPPAPAPPSPTAQPEPATLTGVIRGRWGFDAFSGPTVQLQQLPGSGWHIAAEPESAGIIAGKDTRLMLTSSGSACVHSVTVKPEGSGKDVPVTFHASNNPDAPNRLELTLPAQAAEKPGDLNLRIQQYGQPAADEVAARTFTPPAEIRSSELHAGDRSILLVGTRLEQIERLTLGDLVFRRTAAQDALTPRETAVDATAVQGSLRLSLAENAPAPPTHAGEHLSATVTLRDGRDQTLSLTVGAARPSITVLRKSVTGAPGATIVLSSPDDIPLNGQIAFTLKSPAAFPRNGQIEVQTLDGTLRTVLTLAPSGGLLMQDSHTVVATLDPLRSFGPNAFGPLQVRAVYPEPVAPAKHGADADTEREPSSSDWLRLGTLVRLPVLTQLACPPDPASDCTLSGSGLFLLESLSADPAFANPVAVPDGYTGTSLAVTHATAATLFVHLRDDPKPVDTAVVPSPPAAPAAGTGHHKPVDKPQPAQAEGATVR